MKRLKKALRKVLLLSVASTTLLTSCATANFLNALSGGGSESLSSSYAEMPELPEFPEISDVSNPFDEFENSLETPTLPDSVLDNTKEYTNGIYSIRYDKKKELVEIEGIYYLYFEETSFAMFGADGDIPASMVNEQTILEYFEAVRVSYATGDWAYSAMIGESRPFTFADGTQGWRAEYEMTFKDGRDFKSEVACFLMDGTFCNIVLVAEAADYDSIKPEWEYLLATMRPYEG